MYIYTYIRIIQIELARDARSLVSVFRLVCCLRAITLLSFVRWDSKRHIVQTVWRVFYSACDRVPRDT